MSQIWLYDLRKYNRVILKDDVVCFTDGSRIEQPGLAGTGV